MVALLSLAPLVDDSLLEAGEVVDADEHNKHRRLQRVRINLLRDAAEELQNHYASGTEPGEKRDGTLWYDSTNDILKVRKGQEWTAALNVTSAYETALETAGTETFKVGGVVDVNTTQVSRTSTGDFMSYTVPAGTINANAVVFSTLGFFATSAVGGSNAIFSFGSETSDVIPYGNTGRCFVEAFVVRTGEAAQKIAIVAETNRDDSATTANVQYAAGTESMLADAISKFGISGNSATTQEIMLTQLLP